MIERNGYAISVESRRAYLPGRERGGWGRHRSVLEITGFKRKGSYGFVSRNLTNVLQQYGLRSSQKLSDRKGDGGKEPMVDCASGSE